MIAEKLKAADITSFEQLSKIRGKDLKRAIEAVPDFEQRMKRFDFKDQAKKLHERKHKKTKAKGKSAKENIFSSPAT